VSPLSLTIVFVVSDTKFSPAIFAFPLIETSLFALILPLTSKLPEIVVFPAYTVPGVTIEPADS
jgi:hypothetical protein